jgi:hypothetical protein
MADFDLRPLTLLHADEGLPVVVVMKIVAKGEPVIDDETALVEGSAIEQAFGVGGSALIQNETMIGPALDDGLGGGFAESLDERIAGGQTQRGGPVFGAADGHPAMEGHRGLLDLGWGMLPGGQNDLQLGSAG